MVPAAAADKLMQPPRWSILMMLFVLVLLSAQEISAQRQNVQTDP